MQPARAGSTAISIRLPATPCSPGWNISHAVNVAGLPAAIARLITPMSSLLCGPGCSGCGANRAAAPGLGGAACRPSPAFFGTCPAGVVFSQISFWLHIRPTLHHARVPEAGLNGIEYTTISALCRARLRFDRVRIGCGQSNPQLIGRHASWILQRFLPSLSTSSA